MARKVHLGGFVKPEMNREYNHRESIINVDENGNPTAPETTASAATPAPSTNQNQVQMQAPQQQLQPQQFGTGYNPNFFNQQYQGFPQMVTPQPQFPHQTPSVYPYGFVPQPSFGMPAPSSFGQPGMNQPFPFGQPGFYQQPQQQMTQPSSQGQAFGNGNDYEVTASDQFYANTILQNVPNLLNQAVARHQISQAEANLLRQTMSMPCPDREAFLRKAVKPFHGMENVASETLCRNAYDILVNAASVLRQLNPNLGVVNMGAYQDTGAGMNNATAQPQFVFNPYTGMNEPATFGPNSPYWGQPVTSLYNQVQQQTQPQPQQQSVCSRFNEERMRQFNIDPKIANAPVGLNAYKAYMSNQMMQQQQQQMNPFDNPGMDSVTSAMMSNPLEMAYGKFAHKYQVNQANAPQRITPTRPAVASTMTPSTVVKPNPVAEQIKANYNMQTASAPAPKKPARKPTNKTEKLHMNWSELEHALFPSSYWSRDSERHPINTKGEVEAGSHYRLGPDTLLGLSVILNLTLPPGLGMDTYT